MLAVQAGAGALDYNPCRYGTSRSQFRGPPRDLAGPYLAALGGAATFGKHVAQSYPEVVERALGQPCVNLGATGAGPDFYLSDPGALDIAARARAVIVQVTGVEGVSNAYYAVHSRRNDRIVAPTPALRALFPEVDCADIHFTRHLLTVLEQVDPERFEVVRAVLRATWLRRMQQLLRALPSPRVLLRLPEAPPDGALAPHRDPLSIDDSLLAALAPLYDRLVDGPVPQPDDLRACPETGVAAARCLPGAQGHREIAHRLVTALGSCGPLRMPPLVLRAAASA